jgi:hypothetical protein
MSFASAAALSFGPVLAAILAAALILPRTWLATYAAFVFGAIAIYSGYTSQQDDGGLGGVFPTLFSMLMAATLAAGLVTRWALKSRPPHPD